MPVVHLLSGRWLCTNVKTFSIAGRPRECRRTSLLRHQHLGSRTSGCEANKPSLLRSYLIPCLLFFSNFGVTSPALLLVISHVQDYIPARANFGARIFYSIERHLSMYNICGLFCALLHTLQRRRFIFSFLAAFQLSYSTIFRRRFGALVNSFSSQISIWMGPRRHNK